MATQTRPQRLPRFGLPQASLWEALLVQFLRRSSRASGGGRKPGNTGDGSARPPSTGSRAPSTGRVSSVAVNSAVDLTDEKLEGLDDCLKRCASKLGYVPDCFGKLTVAACFQSERLGRSIDAAGGCPKFRV